MKLQFKTNKELQMITDVRQREYLKKYKTI